MSVLAVVGRLDETTLERAPNLQFALAPPAILGCSSLQVEMAAAQTQTEDEKLAAELAAQDLNAVPEGAADDQGSKLKQLLVRPRWALLLCGND